MRLVLSLLLLASAAPGRSAETPRPVVILVHGRGQLGVDSASLRAEWKRELDASLAALGMPALRDDDVRLAWYADVLDPQAEAACNHGRYANEAGLGSLARDFLVSLASVVPDSGREEDRAARSLLGDMLWLVDPVTRCAAEVRLDRVVERARADGRPVILVAYSLGAVVAYEHLRQHAPRDSSAGVQLITVGSPLGVPVARELLVGDGGPLRVPAGVKRWVNIYDTDDAFAAPLALGSVIDRPVKSARAMDPHGAGRYLRDAETGTALARALCESSAGAWSSRCSAAELRDAR
jgi:hypothetical protein